MALKIPFAATYVHFISAKNVLLDLSFKMRGSTGQDDQYPKSYRQITEGHKSYPYNPPKSLQLCDLPLKSSRNRIVGAIFGVLSMVFSNLSITSRILVVLTCRTPHFKAEIKAHSFRRKKVDRSGRKQAL